jgi:hypothetical protein
MVYPIEIHTSGLGEKVMSLPVCGKVIPDPTCFCFPR